MALHYSVLIRLKAYKRNNLWSLGVLGRLKSVLPEDVLAPGVGEHLVCAMATHSQRLGNSGYGGLSRRTPASFSPRIGAPGMNVEVDL